MKNATSVWLMVIIDHPLLLCRMIAFNKSNRFATFSTLTTSSCLASSPTMTRTGKTYLWRLKRGVGCLWVAWNPIGALVGLVQGLVAPCNHLDLISATL